MPLYEYVCADCDCKFELLRRMSQANDPVTCPRCEREGAAHRLISRFAAMSKDSGGATAHVSGGGSCSGCGGGSCTGCHH
jgi:putative FmdB family regulatory protein